MEEFSPVGVQDFQLHFLSLFIALAVSRRCNEIQIQRMLQYYTKLVENAPQCFALIGSKAWGFV